LSDSISPNRPNRVRCRNGRDPVDGSQLRVHEEASRNSLLRPHLRILRHVGRTQRRHRQFDSAREVLVAEHDGGVGLLGSGRSFWNSRAIAFGGCTKVILIILLSCHLLQTSVRIQSQPLKSGAGATFDWLFFDNSKVINFDD
jgi:hypothetical protein